MPVFRPYFLNVILINYKTFSLKYFKSVYDLVFQLVFFFYNSIVVFSKYFISSQCFLISPTVSKIKTIFKKNILHFLFFKKKY
jgi:hypothetical protein